MFSRGLNKPSPAMIVGMLALAVALGGTSYAAIVLPKNSVGSKQIKRGAVKNSDLGRSAVTTGKVKNGSLLAVDFAAGQLSSGATGPQGPKGDTGATGLKGDTGATGDTGAKGDTGAAGATNVVSRLVTSGTGDATATCNAGEKVVGGGGFSGTVGGVRGFSFRDRPDGPSAAPTGWRYSAETPGGTAVGVDAYVLCASP